MITDPEENEDEDNEGDPNCGCANEEHLTRVLALRALEETRRNSLYYFTIVHCDFTLSRFLGSGKCFNVL